VKRLNTLASLRVAPVPESLDAYASSLSGFSEKAIDYACAAIERSVPAQFAPKFPPLGEMLDACRRSELELRTPRETEWTLERYRDVWAFDKWMAEQVEDGKSRQKILQEQAWMAPAWTRWKNQHLNGSIQIPSGWCENCEGRGVTIRDNSNGSRTVVTCACRRKAA